MAPADSHSRGMTAKQKTAVAVLSVRPYVMDMPEDLSISDTVAPRRAAIALAAGALGLVLAGTVALWAHYGTAIFLEMIRTGMIACFG